MSISEKFTIITDSFQKTISLGKTLGKFLKGGDIISLTGELGSGKTTLIQGIAKGLLIKGVINSPSFSLLNIYKGKIPLYHFDLYRISGEEDLGYHDIFNSSSICVIEWGEKIESILPPSYLKIILSHIDVNKRQFLFIPKDKRFMELVRDVFYNLNNWGVDKR